MKDGQYLDRAHREKIENFRLQIHDDPEEGSNRNSRASISSFSDPQAARANLESAAEAAGASRARLAHKLRDKEKRRGNRRFFRLMWLSMVVLVSLLAAKYLLSGINDMLAAGRQKVAVTVEIPKNATADQVARLFYSDGVIREPDCFELYARLTKAPKTFDGGSYQVDTSMDYEALLNSIQSTKNRVDTVKITITEGMNAAEIANKLEKSGVCSAKDALAIINGTQLDESFSMLQSITNSSARYYRLEGYLFPDTYEFFRNEDPDQAIKKLVSNCNTKLTKQIRGRSAEEHLSIDQMLTLASMIQAEAANKDDMYKVSSVFHNRLDSKEGSLHFLSSDPTTYYPYRKQSLVPANIRSTYKSRYDTYTIKGLPPGPVCSPGLDAIDAALNPASTDDYYFCHDADGKAYYAATSAQHQANLKKAGLR